MTQAIEINVTKDGFEPNIVRVRVGHQVHLRVKRAHVGTCATSIEASGIIPRTRLPLGETVEVVFTPNVAGEFRFGCSMNQHIGGTLVVEG